MSERERPQGPGWRGAGQKGQRRAPWGTISRERVVEAATEAVRDGRYEQMTIRSLAEDLGVAPMSLYRHVRNRDDLLNEVTNQLLAKTWRPRRKSDDWRAWIVDAAHRLRTLLVDQPAALHVYLRHPVVSPAALDRMETMLGVLQNAGLGRTAARHAYAAIHTYTVGFAALEASRTRWSSESGRGDAVEKALTALTTPKQFTEGLGYLLDGIERQARMP